MIHPLRHHSVSEEDEQELTFGDLLLIIDALAAKSIASRTGQNKDCERVIHKIEEMIRRGVKK